MTRLKDETLWGQLVSKTCYPRQVVLKTLVLKVTRSQYNSHQESRTHGILHPIHLVPAQIKSFQARQDSSYSYRNKLCPCDVAYRLSPDWSIKYLTKTTTLIVFFNWQETHLSAESLFSSATRKLSIDSWCHYRINNPLTETITFHIKFSIQHSILRSMKLSEGNNWKHCTRNTNYLGKYLIDKSIWHLSSHWNYILIVTSEAEGGIELYILCHQLIILGVKSTVMIVIFYCVKLILNTNYSTI